MKTTSSQHSNLIRFTFFLLIQSFGSILSQRVSAQITITRQQFGWNAARSYSEIRDANRDSVLVGVASVQEKQLWTFDSLPGDVFSVGKFLNDTTALYHSLFPASTFATSLFSKVGRSFDTTLSYFGWTQDTLLSYGSFEHSQNGTQAVTIYRHPQPKLIFPLTLGLSWSWKDTALYNNAKYIATLSSSVDAYGTMQRAGVDYPCLRIRSLYTIGVDSTLTYYYITQTPWLLATLQTYSPFPKEGSKVTADLFFTLPDTTRKFPITAQGTSHQLDAIASTKVGASTTFRIAIVSVGDTSLRLASVGIAATGQFSDFSIDSAYLGSRIPPGDSTIVRVRFTPTKTGTRSTYFAFNGYGLQTWKALVGTGLPSNSVSTRTSSVDGLSVYPNPTTGLIHIDGLKDVSEITVFDIAGHVVFQSTMTSGVSLSAETNIAISSVPDGVYLLHVTSRTQTANLPIIVQR